MVETNKFMLFSYIRQRQLGASSTKNAYNNAFVISTLNIHPTMCQNIHGSLLQFVGKDGAMFTPFGATQEKFALPGQNWDMSIAAR